MNTIYNPTPILLTLDTSFWESPEFLPSLESGQTLSVRVWVRGDHPLWNIRQKDDVHHKLLPSTLVDVRAQCSSGTTWGSKRECRQGKGFWCSYLGVSGREGGREVKLLHTWIEKCVFTLGEEGGGSQVRVEEEVCKISVGGCPRGGGAGRNLQRRSGSTTGAIRPTSPRRHRTTDGMTWTGEDHSFNGLRELLCEVSTPHNESKVSGRESWDHTGTSWSWTPKDLWLHWNC